MKHTNYKDTECHRWNTSRAAYVNEQLERLTLHTAFQTPLHHPNVDIPPLARQI